MKGSGQRNVVCCRGAGDIDISQTIQCDGVRARRASGAAVGNTADLGPDRINLYDVRLKLIDHGLGLNLEKRLSSEIGISRGVQGNGVAAGGPDVDDLGVNKYRVDH